MIKQFTTKKIAKTYIVRKRFNIIYVCIMVWVAFYVLIIAFCIILHDFTCLICMSVKQLFKVILVYVSEHLTGPL